MKLSTEYHPRTCSSHFQDESSSSHQHPYFGRRHSTGNVTRHLLWREVAPVSRQGFRKLWGESATCQQRHEFVSAKHALVAWLEAESLRNCTAKYCALQPAPRSTIAAAFSPDGSILASTHGDHTVKLFCCKTGICLKTLCGHRRTPWVVRFHPSRSDILASGSLDNEVKIWNSDTAQCIASHDFLRPIASIAFHAQGNLLAVASGHKLYIWQYNRHAEDLASPVIVLRTRRSLRAVHFHPHGAPLLLTAEVIGLDTPDCPMTVATSAGYIQYPLPAFFRTPVQQPFANLQKSGNTNAANSEILLPSSTWASDNDIQPAQENTRVMHHIPVMDDTTGINSEATPMDVSATEHEAINDIPYIRNMGSSVDMLHRAGEEAALAGGSHRRNPGTSAAGNNNHNFFGILPRSETRDSLLGVNLPTILEERQIDGMNLWSNFNVQVLVGDNIPQSSFNGGGDSPGWELPFLQGWVMGQTQAEFVQPMLRSQHGIFAVPGISVEARGLQHHQEANQGAEVTPSIARNGNRLVNATRGNASRVSLNSASSGGATSVHVGILHGFASRDPSMGMIASENAPQLSIAAATAAAELPCTVKLRIWPHNMKHPTGVLDPETCRLTIPHAVLCSEMGAHFSPCGRFLAACVACVLPTPDSDAPFYLRPQTTSAGTSPTRHPISAQQVIYELRVYSLEKATFGQVLASRAIRAAHCLTSIQFSPASDHILLAYGRRHISLLRNFVLKGTTTVPTFTILEVYRVSDMELVKVLPSAEDEVNVACFHPIVGGGFVYGTKEGRLRIFRHERSDRASGAFRTFEDHIFNDSGSSF